MKTLSPASRRAIRKYTLAQCLRAYQLNQEGNGARTIATCYRGLDRIRTTSQADAAINAGAEVRAQEAEKKFAIVYDSAGPFLANYDYANRNY